MKNITPILHVLAAVLILAATPPAKTRVPSGGNPSSQPSSSKAAAGDAATLEARLRPVLEERANFRRGGKGGAKNASSALSAGNPSISQSDIFALMKVWNSLSPEFRELYAEAAAIPKNFDYYVSPGGNFKIFYTTTGRDSVSSLDTISYGTVGQPDTWREKRLGANGVPDYVDEAAFALDSAWSMEVERFGFPKPKAAPDPSGSADRYSVVIVKSSDYGVTYPVARASSGQAGFTSYIEVNGNWSGLEWAGTGYNKRPYDALRVTCAHEFFHSLQYSMVWSVNLDDLSFGWLEGSAVLMEELAFPDVNDYLQYITSYFSNPRIPLLSDDDNYVYMNSIVLKYIYEKGTGGGESIGVIKAVHDNNLAQKNISFHKNLTKSVSEQTGREWASVLNGFHAESYFTGTRARQGMFVSDAGLMKTWRVPTTTAAADTSANIDPYSVGLFMYEPQPDQGDTLFLSVSGQNEASASGATWGASVITADGAGGAEIIPIDIDSKGSGRLEIAGWSGKDYCILVASNAGQSTGRVTVKTGSGAANETALLIAPNKINLRKSNSIRIAGGDISEATIAALNGRIVDRWSAAGGAANGGRSAFKTTPDGSLEWSPAALKKRTVPGVYFITASSTNPGTGKKSTLRRKIMLLP